MDSDKCCHACHSTGTTSSVFQTLDELDFERGIWTAAQYGGVDRVVKILKSGTAVDARDNFGYTALHYAARNGHVDVCKLLLQMGADINAVTKSGCVTALHRAASTGKLNVVELLLKHKADITLHDADGKNVLHRAAENQNKSICEAILSVGSNLKQEKDSRGNRPVDYAISKDLIDILCD